VAPRCLVEIYHISEEPAASTFRVEEDGSSSFYRNSGKFFELLCDLSQKIVNTDE
jgi:hypothetical protein